MAGIPPRGVYYAVVLFLLTVLVFWGQFGWTCLGKGESKSSVVRRTVKIKIFPSCGYSGSGAMSRCTENMW